MARKPTYYRKTAKKSASKGIQTKGRRAFDLGAQLGRAPVPKKKKKTR